MRYYLGIALTSLCIACGGISAPKMAPSGEDDQSLVVRVKTSLLNAPAVHANEIDVDVQRGVAVLRGHVHGQQEIDAAVNAARRVDGIRDVKSELQGDRS